MEDLYVRTEYDDREYRAVVEIYYYDDSGEEVIHKEATKACYSLDTCADMGDETYEVLLQKVEHKLRAEGIQYTSVEIDADEI